MSRSCKVCTWPITGHRSDCMVSKMSLVELSYADAQARREVVVAEEVLENAEIAVDKASNLSKRISNELAARILSGEGFVK